MLKKITGPCFKDMVTYGINYLEKHCNVVNDLNVFPVPDGDTGTNMVMTMKNGLQALDRESESLSIVAQSFANGTVFGARGNSGVIISQFFKGLSEGFRGAYDADPTLLSDALEEGCAYAYAAVAKPVEGTVLTVLKDSSRALKERLVDISSIDEAFSVLLASAKVSLENTPNLLSILAKAGVIDSGGAGLVYFFEGIQRYLSGEPLETVDAASPNAQYVDYSVFNRYSSFEYGYCTEALLQLTVDENEFDKNAFASGLQGLGESIVTSFEGDKIKVHIHTQTPENVLAFCHRFGEFLSLKIENMSVQHTQTYQKFMCTDAQEESCFAIVAVAPNAALQKIFSDMGADVSMLSPEVPSSQDFIEAFRHVSAKEILVFSNNSNSILSAMQAGSLYQEARVTVLNCRSIAECYSAMAAIDFDEPDIQRIADCVNSTIENIYEVDVVRAVKFRQFGDTAIEKGDYFSMSGDDVLKCGKEFENVVLETVRDVSAERECTVVSLFYGQNVSAEQAERLAEKIGETYPELDVCTIPTQDAIFELILSFE